MLIPYPISVDYMSHWALQHAVREVLQNAIDSGQFYVDNNFSNINVINKVQGPIDHKELLWLGQSNKKPGSIGKFGEGLKLALLVLARADIPHSFSTPDCTLRGAIVNGQFHIDLLEEANQHDTCTFCIISEQANAIVDKLLLNNKKYKLLAEHNGNQCIDLPGHIYVNGLLVTDKAGTTHGYNFIPSALTLDRDRQAVNDFDLTWETSKLLASCMEPKQVAKLMYEGRKDAQYVDRFITPAIKEACLAHFTAQYGKNAIIARTAEEEKVYRLFNPGKQVVYLGSGCSGYSTAVGGVASKDGTMIYTPKEKPGEVMLDFFERNKKHVRAKALKELKMIVQASTRWTKS